MVFPTSVMIAAKYDSKLLITEVVLLIS